MSFERLIAGRYLRAHRVPRALNYLRWATLGLLLTTVAVFIGHRLVDQHLSQHLSQFMWDLRSWLRAAKFVTVLATDRSSQLPAASVDRIFICDTYHHFEYPQAMLSTLHAALKPGGRLVVIDYERIAGRSSSWILGHVRAGRATVIAEVEAAGFALLRSHDFLRENYFLEFRRR